MEAELIRSIRGTAPGLEDYAAANERSALGMAIGAANYWHGEAEKRSKALSRIHSDRGVRRVLWFCVGAAVSLVACGVLVWLRR
jgi:hypothetical protein